jgi:glutathione S-transferase
VYILHIGNKNYSSWSLRPWVLMRALGIPFTEKLHVFGQGSLKQFSPSGRVPSLVDDGVTVWDSLAITEHVAERNLQVWPTDVRARAWARSATAEMHSGFAALRHGCSFCVGLRIALHDKSPALLADLARLNELWADGLKQFGGPFLAGPAFSAVDAFFAPIAFRVQTYGLPLGAAQAVYAQRLLSLTAMREWESAALAEPWRDRTHDDEILALGAVTEDLRAPVAAR